MQYILWAMAIVGLIALVGWCSWLDHKVELARIEHGIEDNEDE